MQFLSLLPLLVAHMQVICAIKVQSIGGKGWTLTQENGSISVPAQVPSQQYLDLYDAGKIGDPLFGFNNTDQQWVALGNWTYTSPSLAHLKSKTGSTFLIFEGLDTFTEINLCGKHVGNTANMYRQYIFNVTEQLRMCKKEPRLQMQFKSAVNVTHAISKGPLNDGDASFEDSCNDSPGSEFSCKAYARKEQNDFGWDWSPSLTPAGPWQDIEAVQLSDGQIYAHNALIDIYRKGQMNNLPPDQTQPWIFNASIDFIGTIPSGKPKMELQLVDSQQNVILKQSLQGVHHSAQTITGATTIAPHLVQLWWPNGLGAQNLYNATIVVTTPSGDTLETVQRKVGFRTMVLNLGKITDDQLAQGIAPGANWHFEANGQEFYAKGSNFVPPDAFWPRVNETRVTQLFQLAKDANMNMLRVWSSGIYLHDWIYDIADEMGILLWSEFQFTDAEYPNGTYFLEQYEAEAYYNVRRVNYHPSLALWVGGNELEAIALAYFFNATDPSPLQLQYEQIFLETLIKCVYANTRSISYIPSSTYHGYLHLDFDSTMPQVPRWDNTSGPNYIYEDTDAYNYDAQTLFDLNAYPIGRFADEFGFHSMPSAQTWKDAASPDELYYPSDTIINHNRHYSFGSSGTTRSMSLSGIDEMTQAVKMYLPTPNLQDSFANFTAWCWSTQVVQAADIAFQIAFYRRGSGMPERQLGSLYWMFDDLWAAPTWASVESTNRQKVLYYAAKDIFQPVIVAPYYNTSTQDLQVWVTSDLMQPASGTMTYSWIDWHGHPLTVNDSDSSTARSHAIPFHVGALNSIQTLHYTNLSTTLAQSGSHNHNALLLLSINATSKQTAYSHSSVFYIPSALATAQIPNPGLKLSRQTTNGAVKGSTVSFTVTATKAVAAYVWLDYATNAVQGYWSQNGFWLNKGESRTVAFTVWNDWSNGKWVDTVEVRSVYDNTLS